MARRFCLWLLVGAWAGCNNPTYLSQQRPLETRPAEGGGVMPDRDLYVVPVRRPSTEERRALELEQMMLGLTMETPWVGVRDFEIAVHYTIKNLEDKKVRAFFTIDGGNEFGDYDPALYVDPTVDEEDQEPPPSLVFTPPIDLEPNEIRTGVVREDEIAEAALDLEAITRYPPGDNPFETPYQVILRHSSASRIGLEGIPENDVIPAVVRYHLGLTASGHVVLDYSVRVRDRTGKLARPDDDDLYVPDDATLPPPAAPPAAPMMP